MKLSFSSATLALAAAPAMLLAVPAHAQAEAQEGETMNELAEEKTALEMRAQQVVALVNGDLEVPLDEVFGSAFLSQIPEAQLRAISDQLTGQFGAALSVESLGTPDANRSSLAIRMERAIARGGLVIDPSEGNRISELLFQTFDPIDDSPEKIRADLSALPGTTNALLARLGPDGAMEPVFAHNAEEPLALGSAFKLYVLSALSRSIAAGERSWDDVVQLSQRSFPSGQMQDWPDGAPVTLHTLATMMISISDNTATDQLIAELGREAVEAELVASGNADPSRTLPFLTTRQLFAMRGVSEELIERYRGADDEEQRAILADLREEDVSEDRVSAVFGSNVPGAIDIEWFASPMDLARLLHRMTDNEDETALAIMAVNPSLPDAVRTRWDYAGYKGGSEPGVLNLTWLLRDAQGQSWIATVGWNNPDAALTNSALETIAQRMIALAPIDPPQG
ncbi:MAG: serine hydrolase [Erythrobacter sp.]